VDRGRLRQGFGAHGRLPVAARYTARTTMPQTQPLVGVIMGSRSDWETMRQSADVLEQFGVAFEARVVSAHRTPDLMREYANEAEGRGLEVIIAGAGGAAHLPGMVASQTLVPVIGVPVQSKALNGLDSLLSIVQMPGGVPVATMAIGGAGARNAALLAVAMLAVRRPELREKLRAFRVRQELAVRSEPLE
jgi:5-(carboxyamino)imidazole ribonucleotide mutase